MDTASPCDPIDLIIVIQDQEADPEDLEKLTQRTARLLEDFAEEVNRVVVSDLPGDSPFIGKGSGILSNILDLKIDLGMITSAGQFLYERFAGSSTEVTFKYGEVEFTYKGRDPKDRVVALEELKGLIAHIENQQAASK